MARLHIPGLRSRAAEYIVTREFRDVGPSLGQIRGIRFLPDMLVIDAKMPVTAGITLPGKLWPRHPDARFIL